MGRGHGVESGGHIRRGSDGWKMDKRTDRCCSPCRRARQRARRVGIMTQPTGEGKKVFEEGAKL